MRFGHLAGALLILLSLFAATYPQGEKEKWAPEDNYRKAKVLMEKQRFREALDLFLTLRDNFPQYNPLAVQRDVCRLYEKLGRIPQALKEYDILLERFPSVQDRFQILMRMAAMSEVALNDLDRAWHYLEMIPEDEVPPGDMAPYLFNKAYLLEKMGKTQDALGLYERLEREYPDTVGGGWAKERIEELVHYGSAVSGEQGE
jgi:tetratricopeptide (TPR) repeat protein